MERMERMELLLGYEEESRVFFFFRKRRLCKQSAMYLPSSCPLHCLPLIVKSALAGSPRLDNLAIVPSLFPVTFPNISTVAPLRPSKPAFVHTEQEGDPSSTMASSVDAKLLKQTKFPPEFNQKVDMKKVNVEVMKK